MSLARLKILKQAIRYNRPLAFNLSGRDVKILCDAILINNPTTELLKDIMNRKTFNSTLLMPLSGIDVKNLLDAIACPQDNLKLIRQQLRFNKKHEYILTGIHVKLIVESIEYEGCLAPPILQLFTTSVLFSGNPSDDIIAGSYGNTAVPGIAFLDQAYLPDWLQSTVMPTSGASLTVGDGGWDMFIIHDSLVAPDDWTWNGDPIVWNYIAPATLGCYDTGFFSLAPDPDPANWVQIFVTTAAGVGNPQGLSPVYTDAGFAAYWDMVAKWYGGADATTSFEVDLDLNTVRLQILNTYNAFASNTSFNGGLQVDVFNSIAC